MLPSGYFDMSRAELGALPVGVAREVYRAHLDRAAYFMGRDAARAWADAHRDGGSQEAWILAVRSSACTCERCQGTGRYSWGACVNGRMAHVGDCYRCQGKGAMTFDDMRRCVIYDQVAIARACAI